MIGKFQEMDIGKRPQGPIRAEIGEWAEKAPPVVSESEFVASYKCRFPEKGWPSRAYECTSVETADGSLRIWDRSSGVPTAIAVASSCALPGLFAPVTVNGHRYMDGGVRSATNADLASGFNTVLVVAPTFGQTNPIAKHGDLLNELKALRKSGCKVELIVPDNASLKAIGAMLGDESRRAPAANVGLLERVIGSIRRECLDHIVIFNERHLRRVLTSYVDHYHGTRTHLSLDKDCPDPRPIMPRRIGKVIAIAQVGGLHHRYECLAA